MFDISSFAQGLVLGLGLFVCPGPKDVLILRQALCRRSAAELIAVATLSDACLIWLGMAGASAALNRAPTWQNAALWLGVGLMVAHGLLAAKRAWLGSADVAALAARELAPTRRKSLATLLTVSFFNPVAWLDTVLVIGTTGAALPHTARLSFALGAVAASLAWFLALVLGARRAGRWMTQAKNWRALDVFVAAAMLGLAAFVASGLL